MPQIRAKHMDDDNPEGYDQYSQVSVSNLINMFYGSIITELQGDHDDTEPAYSNADIVNMIKRNAYEIATMLNDGNTDMTSGIAVNTTARRVMKSWCKAAGLPLLTGCIFDDCDTCNYNKKLEGNKNE